VPETVGRFVEEGIEIAYDVDALRSALTSLQRLVDQPTLRTWDWHHLIFSATKLHPKEWSTVRDILTRTPLLSPDERIELLAHEPQLWTGAERDRQFHNSISYLARWQAKQPDHCLQADNTRTLIGWTRRCIGRLGDTNAPLTAGLLLSPESVKDEMVEWLRRHPFSFNNWWLFVAWLDAALPPEDLSLWMWLWL
jgi:hypothetical protein